MCHGTSHHLGIDVHDCAHSRKEFYIDGTLKEGMTFTIEPGLYFKSIDALVPDAFKSIGVRIEDDVLITKNGSENLSGQFPRTAEEVEKWVSSAGKK
jgi:Xaa-Pro aminopeptidase